LSFIGQGAGKTILTVSNGKRIFESTASSLTLKHLALKGVRNAAVSGGAVISKSSSEGNALLVCENVDFIDNTAQNGAAAYALGGTIVFKSCNFTGNKSDNVNLAYGCLNLLSNGYEMNVEIAQCLFTGNTAKNQGSAIRMYLKDNALIRIQNSTFYANTMDAAANGVIAIEGVNASENVRDVKLIHNTIVGNTNTSGQTAGIYTAVPNVLGLYNNIIAGNTGNAIQLATSTTYLNVVMNNAIDNGIAVGTAANPNFLTDLSQAVSSQDICDSSYDGICESNLENISAGDLQLQSLADNGGATFSLALGNESIAVDAGTEVAVETDQRGYLRDNQPDMGAYEYAAVPLAVERIDKIRKLNIYPNPFSGIVKIESAQTISKIEIFSIKGLKIREILTSDNEINVNFLSAGHYVFSVTDERNHRETILMIKQ
jgi:predicted outer membrane repeat protein